MAAKRKGGLKLNAICAKLSRQVVTDHKEPDQAHTEQAPQERESTGSGNKDVSPQPGAKEPAAEFPEGPNRVHKIEEDKRREVIEKWVNGEYSEEPLLGRIESKDYKGSEGPDVPPEGVYMVQPKGCSDEEDNGDEANPVRGSREGSFPDDRDSDGPPLKDESLRASSNETGSKLSGGSTSGKAGVCGITLVILFCYFWYIKNIDRLMPNTISIKMILQILRLKS